MTKLNESLLWKIISKDQRNLIFQKIKCPLVREKDRSRTTLGAKYKTSVKFGNEP